MDFYCEEVSKQTPEARLSLDTMEFLLKGFSRPENADKYYQPIYAWINKNEQQIMANGKKLNIIIDLDFINSSSLIYIIKLLKQCVDVRHARNLEIFWYYDECDAEDIIETCDELCTVIGIPFTMVCRP